MTVLFFAEICIFWKRSESKLQWLFLRIIIYNPYTKIMTLIYQWTQYWIYLFTEAKDFTCSIRRIAACSRTTYEDIAFNLRAGQRDLGLILGKFRYSYLLHKFRKLNNWIVDFMQNLWNWHAGSHAYIFRQLYI
jgi:hypothetical protein